MINSYLNVTVIAEWCTFIASVLLLDKKTTHWRLFIILLFLVLCTETAGWYMYNKLGMFNNALPFNILMLLSNVFFIWFFSTATALQQVKKWLTFFSSFFLAFGLINLFFFQGLWVYNSFSESLGDIILVLICCYFIFTLLKAREHIDLLRFDYFWLATGLLFYCLGSALLYQFSNLLGKYYEHTKVNIGEYINYALNLILYSSLIIAFICRRKTTR
ncbi:MAG: hypothetical protein IPP72_06300 [Chitinophagaceae bacterium]|nr:hypothetical protein [Chitinophagaceae bacterium]